MFRFDFRPEKSISCGPAFISEMHDVCLEASQFQPLKISRFPNQIICGNSLMMPVGSGKGSCIFVKPDLTPYIVFSPNLQIALYLLIMPTSKLYCKLPQCDT